LYWIASGQPKDGFVIDFGTIDPLDPDECQDLTYNPADNEFGASGKYMFKAYQRPGHPGTGELWSEAGFLRCDSGTSVTAAPTLFITVVDQSGHTFGVSLPERPRLVLTW
jgi:hypothetical protein